MGDDREWLEKLGGTDSSAALSELIRRHGRMVERTAARQLGDPHLAQDVCQAVFWMLLKKARGLTREGSIAGWLHRAAILVSRNASRAEAQRRKRENAVAKMTKGMPSAEPAALPEGFDRALAGLPENYRQVVILRYLEGRSRTEIARTLALTEGAVDVRLSRGLDRLRRTLAVGVPGLTVALLVGSLTAEASAATVAGPLALATGAVGTQAPWLAQSALKAMVWFKVKVVTAAICAAAVVAGGGVVAIRKLSAVSTQPPVVRKGPLAGLPGLPGPHIARIRAMGDNEWLSLGAPEPDPRWGRARGRGWGAKMAGAPDLRGGFLAGFSSPNDDTPLKDHTRDDLWFYDLNAHRWICVYPGQEMPAFNRQVRDKTLSVDSEGQLAGKDGQPLPVGSFTSSFGNVTYDTDQRLFAFQSPYNCSKWILPAGLAEGVDALLAQGLNSKPSSPWFYSTAEGRFIRSAVTGLPPWATEPAWSHLFYIPDRKKFISLGKGGVAWFDPAARAWTTVDAKGPRPQGVDNAACYDPRRDRIYFGGGSYVPDSVKTPGDNFFIFDLKTGTWSQPNPKGDFPICMNSNFSFFNFDAANDAAVLLDGWGRDVFVYAPDENAWTKLPSTAPEPIKNAFGARSGNGFYDAELNATFCHFAREGHDEGTIWVYRYRKAVK